MRQFLATGLTTSVFVVLTMRRRRVNDLKLRRLTLRRRRVIVLNLTPGYRPQFGIEKTSASVVNLGASLFILKRPPYVKGARAENPPKL